MGSREQCRARQPKRNTSEQRAVSSSASGSEADSDHSSRAPTACDRITTTPPPAGRQDGPVNLLILHRQEHEQQRASLLRTTTRERQGPEAAPSGAQRTAAGPFAPIKHTKPSSTARPQTRHKRQSSYASMHWLLASLLCLACHNAPPAAAGGTLVINIGEQQRALAKRSAGAPRQQEGASAKLLQEVDALHYLQRYGYLNESLGSNSNLIAEDSFHEAIVLFQRFAGLPESGAVDAQTLRYMQMPRCGNKDLGRGAESGRRRRKRRRRKRYALQGSKWRRQELTYRISQYPSRFQHKRHEVDGQIEKAFRIWSQVAPIDFVVKREGRVHIDIRFASGEHGDGDPFDGPGNTLAHAYFPQYGGDAHFDDQEYWTVDSYAGTNIFQVAAHELGHSLGLGHSSVREALMAPFYQKYKPNFRLHADDVLAIQALYGERDEPSSTSSTSTTEAAPPRRGSHQDEAEGEAEPEEPEEPGKPVDLCREPKIDAATRTEDGSTYVFRGQYYWQIKNEGLASGSPGKISRDWDGLPGDLDAALTWSDGKTFFFKGDKYWRFFNRKREPGYPKQIGVGFAGIPNNLDAAFVWSGNGKTYFFKRDKYWRFDSKQEPPVSSQYPKPLRNWAGLPGGPIDAALRWENGMTYFFKDDLYYRFDDRQFEVDTSARPAFPRSTAEWWFGCPDGKQALRRKAEEPLEARASQSALLFHRRPSLALEGGAPAASRSLSRSILSSLSSLLPSAADSPPDWAFHSGLGEETRRLARRDSAHSEPSSSRWLFPLGSAATVERGGREQSLSAELRAAHSDYQRWPPNNATSPAQLAETN